MAELTDNYYDKINEELNKRGDNYTKATRTVICTEVCGHMFEQGFTLDQISKSMPWLDKSDIMGFSLTSQFLLPMKRWKRLNGSSDVNGNPKSLKNCSILLKNRQKGVSE